MIKRLLSAIFSALPLAAAAAPCLPLASLIERDARYEEALRSGDPAFLQDWLADDFVWVHNLASSVDTKASVLARAAKPPVIYKARSTSDVRGHVQGNAVALRGLSSVEQWNPDDKTWRTARYQFLRGYVTVDGQCKLLAVQTMKVWSSEAEAAAVARP
jgi:hypothetical protein